MLVHCYTVLTLTSTLTLPNLEVTSFSFTILSIFINLKIGCVNHTILNTLSLVWGVQGFYYDRGTTTDQTIKETKEILKQEKHLKKGDLVVNLASMTAKEMGMNNMMKISKVK